MTVSFYNIPTIKMLGPSRRGGGLLNLYMFQVLVLVPVLKISEKVGTVPNDLEPCQHLGTIGGAISLASAKVKDTDRQDWYIYILLY